MQNPSLLSIRNMRIWYTPDTPVLNGFSLNLASNEAVGPFKKLPPRKPAL